jgi:hypothetical protein
MDKYICIYKANILELIRPPNIQNDIICHSKLGVIFNFDVNPFQPLGNKMIQNFTCDNLLFHEWITKRKKKILAI